MVFKKDMKGNIGIELTVGTLILSLFAVLISFAVTLRLWEKKHIEIEAFNIQRIFHDIKKNNQSIENIELYLPSGYSYGIYNMNKDLIKGIDILSNYKKIPTELEIEYEDKLLYPSITLVETIDFKENKYILAIKRDFDIEKYQLKKIVVLFIPFCMIIIFSITFFSFWIYKKRILNPLNTLKKAYDSIDNYSSYYILKNIGIHEWDSLFNQFNEMMKRLREYEDKLKKKIDELEEANKRIKNAQDEIIFSEKMATVGRLSAGLAHEIGNPLTSIIGYISSLRAITEDKETKEILSIILDETERINRIVRDLLNFARVERRENLREIADPIETIEETLKLLSPQRDFTQVTIEKDYKDQCYVIFSKEELKQVILNILLNALDVTPPNGKITISTFQKEDYYIISIEDEGGGIPEDLKNKIFEPFFTTKPIGKGTGLGLSVAHTLVQRYEGKIEFENTPKGAKFYIMLKKGTI
ncbi:MAG: ATP-binding protein [Proteobacteria bacterium]|nr:ATP-binding protein [Pseudomonadota bacterium]